MKVTFTKLPKSTAELTVELETDELRPHLERAAQRLSQQRPVPGFRPGKAPYEVMRKAVGADVLYHEAFEPVVRATLPKAVMDEKLQTVGTPRVDVLKIAENNPLVYKATVALLPAVQLADYRAMTVEKKTVQVDETEVDAQIERLRQAKASEQKVEREARMGDKVEIDFTGYLDKVPIDGASSKTHPLTLGAKQFIPGFEEQIAGMKTGETKDFTVRFPKDYREKRLADRDVEFRVKLLSVLQIDLPAVTDEFAKLFGPYATVDELRKHLRERTQFDKEEKERERLELAMLEKIMEHSTFGELPDSLVDGEVDKMLHELKDGLGQRGLEYSKYLESIKKSEEDLKKEFRGQAERRLKLALITRTIAEREHIEVPDDEVRKEVEATKRLYQNNPEIVRDLSSPEYFSYLKHTLTSKKVYGLLGGVMGSNKKPAEQQP